MNALQRVFEYQGQQVRTIIRSGEPWWVLKDVCDILSLGSPHKVAERLDEDDRNQIPLIDSIGRSQQTTIVNESGLYDVILRSDKPEAKVFKKWITHEVIPAIRKHGAYLTPERVEEVLLNPDTIIRLATQLKQEREEKQHLQAQAETDRPKVLFADSVTASPSSILIRDMAKILRQNGVETGEKRLYARLREAGYLIRRVGSDYNMPTQRSMEMGLFEIKETAVTHSDGRITVTRTPKVTGKGQLYFVNKFKAEKAV